MKITAEEKKKNKVTRKALVKGESQSEKANQETKVSILDTVKDKVGFIEKAGQFLREVRVEFKKVAWPSRKEAMGTTFVVIVLVLIIALFLGLIDMALAKLIKIFIK
ncbi:MAG: preprotein translocase subunit SecE [Desulfovibrionales bacterium]|nr:preprotein translocase subunit SecE [Desulfovibrionales bacterium]